MPTQAEYRVPPQHPTTNTWKSEHLAHFKDPLPTDPREWSRQDVSKWLTEMASRHRLGDVRTERFLMNGKALCLMTLDMYQHRVPLGGKLLYGDFQMRLARALYLQECKQNM